MGGMYNAVFGISIYAPELLTTLCGKDIEKISRFRDCFLNKDGSEAIIYTRTGGNNRDDYLDSIRFLQGLPGYLGDEDDPYDATYAIFRYEIPEEFKEFVPLIKELGLVKDPYTMWAEFMEKLRKETTHGR